MLKNINTAQSELNEHEAYMTQTLVDNFLRSEVYFFENISPIEDRTINLPVQDQYLEGNTIAQELLYVYTQAGYTLTITTLP